MCLCVYVCVHATALGVTSCYGLQRNCAESSEIERTSTGSSDKLFVWFGACVLPTGG